MTDSISKIAVLGAGTMGRGIAQVAAYAGFETVLFDVHSEALEKSVNDIQANFEKGISKGKVDADIAANAKELLSTTTSLETASASADLVIEAVPENFDLKQRLLSEVVSYAKENCVFASNTSSLSISKLGTGIGAPTKVIGMHFFNPVHIMALLEIVVGDETNENTLNACREVGEKMGKECIVVKDVPGFATSRLGIVLGMEAIRMVEQGVASAQDIDTAMELGYRHPMGPLRLTDLVGLDVRLGIAEYLTKELKSDAFQPPQLLRDMVASGKLGKKSGEGFYNW